MFEEAVKRIGNYTRNNPEWERAHRAVSKQGFEDIDSPEDAIRAAVETPK